MTTNQMQDLVSSALRSVTNWEVAAASPQTYRVFEKSRYMGRAHDAGNVVPCHYDQLRKDARRPHPAFQKITPGRGAIAESVRVCRGNDNKRCGLTASRTFLFPL